MICDAFDFITYLTLPYPTLPYPTLPYPTLPYPTLPYPTLRYCPPPPFLFLPLPTHPRSDTSDMNEDTVSGGWKGTERGGIDLFPDEHANTEAIHMLQVAVSLV